MTISHAVFYPDGGEIRNIEKLGVQFFPGLVYSDREFVPTRATFSSSARGFRRRIPIDVQRPDCRSGRQPTTSGTQRQPGRAGCREGLHHLEVLRMKKFAILLALSMIASSAFAIMDDGISSLGVYFDNTGNINCFAPTPGVPFNVYFIVANPAVANMGGFEFAWRFAPPVVPAPVHPGHHAAAAGAEHRQQLQLHRRSGWRSGHQRGHRPGGPEHAGPRPRLRRTPSCRSARRPRRRSLATRLSTTSPTPRTSSP